MDCREVKEKWEAYLEGSLPPEQEAGITAHLEGCAACRRLLDAALHHEAPASPNPAGALDEKKQQRLLRIAKWKNRVSNLVFALAVFLLFGVLSSILTALWFWHGEPGRMDSAQRTAVLITEMTMPNIMLTSSSVGTGWFFTAEGRVDMAKRMGRETRPLGALKTKMFFNRLTANRDWAGESYSSTLFFIHPAQAIRGSDLASFREPARETLAMLPDGTVAEMAVSFDRLYTIDEALALLQDYDMEVVWLAVDTGVEKQPGYPLGALRDIWGFSDTSTLEYEWPLEAHSDGDKRARAFMKGMEFLLQHEEWAQKAYRGLNLNLAERHAHLSKHGVRLYGVVVTGPSPELRKLQDADHIRLCVIGEAALWNWSPRLYHSTVR